MVAENHSLQIGGDASTRFSGIRSEGGEQCLYITPRNVSVDRVRKTASKVLLCRFLILR